MWRVGGETCQCGCASGSDDSAGGDSDESAEIDRQTQMRKRQLEKAMDVYRDSVQELMQQERAEADRKRVKGAGGGAKSTNSKQ